MTNEATNDAAVLPRKKSMSWLVDVSGYDSVIIVAPTKPKARFAAYRRWSEAFGGTFREFLARGVTLRPATVVEVEIHR